MSETKTVRTTGVTNEHTHRYDDAESGRTTETDGHTHPYTVRDDGTVRIGPGGSDRHTHTPAPANRAKGKNDMSDMEHKDYLQFELKQFEEDDDFFFFKAYGSTFGNTDLLDDVVVKGAFEKSLREMTPKLLYQHDMRKPVGIITSAKEDNIGLFLEGKLPKSVTLSKDVGNMLKTGVIDSMSIGFSVEKFTAHEDGVRFLEELKLFEVSFVTLPANPSARVTDIKTVVPFQDLPLSDRTRPWSASAAIKRVREWAGAEDAPNAKFRRAFLWFDREDQDNFGAYKLPIGDIIDGKFTAVWRGVTAAAGAIQGARGGVDIPEGDVGRIQANLSRYYAKARNKFDDDTIIPPWEKSFYGVEDVKEFTKRNFEKALRESGCFSNGACVFLASKLIETQSESDGEDNKLSVDAIKGIEEIIKILKGDKNV